MTTTLDPRPSTLPKVQLTFEFQGKQRLLNKHPEIQRQLSAGEIREEDARNTAWYLRVRFGERREVFKLPMADDEAIKKAKEHLKAKDTTEFSEFRKERAAKRAFTLQELATEWLAAKMPDATGHDRVDRAIDQLTIQLNGALKWSGFATKSPALVTPVTMREFATWRRAQCKAKGRGTGNRSIDVELGALSCLCDWAVSLGKITANPFAKRPTFQREDDISHCHEFAPDSDEDWHKILHWFFTYNYTRNTERKSKGKKLATQDAHYTLRLRIIGAWLAFTGLTGIRPEEPQFLFRYQELTETPGNPSKLFPGQIFTTRTKERKMRIQRGKNGQNPFVAIHPALVDFLAHWTEWLDSTFGLSTLNSQLSTALFPDPENPKKSIFGNGDFTPIVRRLTDACDELKISRLKPKGFGRAYYVRVRRSQGADDSIIASELGQTTNGKLIRDTYGNPDDMAGGALFDWLPSPSTLDPRPLPAWQLLNLETATNVISL